jgi:hypothetical protein
VERERLIGWLCIARYHFWNDLPFRVPPPVRSAMLAMGWVEITEDPDGEDNDAVRVTDAGCAISDLWMPEWGVDPLPVED